MARVGLENRVELPEDPVLTELFSLHDVLGQAGLLEEMQVLVPVLLYGVQQKCLESA